MKLSDIIRHTQKNMPKYSGYFSNVIKVEELTSIKNTCTVKTDKPHNLKSGDLFTIEGAKFSNKIVSLTQKNGLGVLITEHPHEVTKNSPLREGDSTHIHIYNANEEAYNGEFLIMAIPDENTIEFSISENAPAKATGTPEIKEQAVATYNGRQLVSTVIDDTSFTFMLPYIPASNTATGNMYIKQGIRISGDFSVQHAIKAYEENGANELWGFVVLDGANMSKSRTNGSDAIMTYEKGNALKGDLIQDVSFFVFIPTSDDYCWVDYVDICQELRYAVMKTLHNARFSSGSFDDDCYLTFVGDQPVDTEGTAYAIYQYKFQTTINIYNEDGVEPEFTGRLKSFELHDKNNFENLKGTKEYISIGELPNEYSNSNSNSNED